MIIEPTTVDELDKIIKEAGGKTLVYFGAPAWCGPCKQFEPHFKGASEKSDIPFVLVDIDKVRNAQMRYLIKSVPTVKLYDQGEFVRQVTPAGAPALLRDITS